MKILPFLPSLLLLAASLPAAEAPPHPRLVFPRSAEAGVKERVKNDPVMAVLRDRTMAEAERVCGGRTCRYEIPDGKRLLAESRLAVHNVLFTAMAWRLTGEDKFRARCLKELEAACALKDWNPPHFLDTAEMSTAVALGYDWLFDTLSAEQKDRYHAALLEKGLRPGRKVYEGGGGWTKGTNNWSQVCATGLGLAAEALAEVEPEMHTFFRDRCLKTNDDSLAFYEPDGVYPEGPGYWSYGTSYHVLFLAMREALGLPAKTSRPLLRSTEYMAQVTGPTGGFFNYADCGAGREEPVAAYAWLAARNAQTWTTAWLRGQFMGEDARRRKGEDRFFPLQLLWMPPAPAKVASPSPLAAVFTGPQPLACFRTSWSDPQALWVAAKGGTTRVSHGHMDVGSFVLDALGERWVHDLGGDDYNLPGYFGGQRFSYFRLQNLSHNTLSIGGRLQEAKAAPGPLRESALDKPPYRASFDLSPSYAGQAKSVQRSVSLDPGARTVRLADRLEAPVAAVRWAIMTDAEPVVEGKTVKLRKHGKEIVLTRLAPDGAAWKVVEAKPPTEKEKQNKGYRLVTLEAPVAPEVRIEVEFAVPGGR